MLKDDYKKSVNLFTEATCDITAEDILKRANNKDVIDFSSRKKGFSKKKFIVVLAACMMFMAFSTVALAANGIGPLADLFRKNFDDDVSAEMVDEGYCYELNQHGESEDGQYIVDLIAVTGDKENPIWLVDITINNKSITKNKKIDVEAYILPTYRYENEIEHYGTWEGEAVRDEDNHSLYHARIRGGTTNGDEVVFDLCKIHAYSVDSKLVDYDTNVEFRLAIPEETFHDVTYQWYQDLDSFEHGGIAYRPCIGIFGEYKAEINFVFVLTEEQLARDDGDHVIIDGELHDSWLELAHNLYLVVDGVEYQIVTDELYACEYDDGASHVDRRYNIYTEFPGIDFENAKEILLKYNGKEIVLPKQ